MKTQATIKRIVVALALFGAFAGSVVQAADGDKIKVKGVITGVQGDSIVIVDESKSSHTIDVTDQTVLKKTKGLTGVIHEKIDRSVLAAGLPVAVEGVAAGDRLTASEIKFKSEDLKTTQQIQAGLASTNARMDDFGSYDLLASTEVLFDSGSATLSAAAQSDLAAFAEKAKQTDAYQIVLQGFTDSTGSAAANQRLSTRRADAVSNYLQQQAGLSPGRVHAGDGMGVAPDAGSGDNAGARKVIVKLVVDKGVQSGVSK